jgi:UDP-N-acetylmuramyl pentapeptide synthase
LSAINGADGVQFTLNDRSQFFVPIPGIHNACNAAAAIAVARRLGLENELIREALSKAKGPEMRMEQSVHAGVRFVNDAYNANPESAIAAAHAFEDLAVQLKPLRRVVVLGDMLELGGAGPASHEEVARVIASSVKPQVVIVVGPLATSHMAPIFEEASEVIAVPTLDGEKAGKMARLIHSGDLVLLKGSRGMRLERLLAAFCEQASLVTEGAPATPKLPSP